MTERYTTPGTVQVRILTDIEDTDKIAALITHAIKDAGYNVIDCSGQFPDRMDPDHRRKVHITAIPAVDRGG
jgi:hypothetical protein